MKKAKIMFVLMVGITMGSLVWFAEAKEAPSFVLRGIDGQEYRLETFQGQPVVINFFSVNCPHCQTELKVLEKLYREYKDKALLTVLAINMGDSEGAVKRFAQRLGLSLPVLLDSEVTVARQYNVLYVPTVFFINPRGEVVDGFIGAQREDVTRRKLEGILWFRGLREPEVRNLVALTSRVVILDIRKEGVNPFDGEEHVVYRKVQELDQEIDRLNREDVHLLLVSSSEEGIALGRKLTQAGFTRVYYQMVDAS